MVKISKKQRAEAIMFLQEDIKIIEKSIADHIEANNKKPNENSKMLARTYTEILKELKVSLAKLVE